MHDSIWMSDATFLETFLRAYAEAKAGTMQSGKAIERADITISGMLLPTVPGWMREFGLQATGYDEIVEQAEAAAKARGDTVYMAVDSGGGAVRGLDRAVGALRTLAQSKRIVAYVDGMSASAAYWLTAMAHEIHATKMSEVGSIGAYAVLPDGGNKVVVIRSAPHKGTGIDALTEEQISAHQDVIDRLGGMFLEDVIRARPDATLSEIGSGRTWLSDQARELGLVDAVTNVGALGAKQQEQKKMSDELTARLAETQARLEAVEKAAKYKDSMLAAFPDDPKFALAQIEKGATIEQAQAEQITSLKAALAVQSQASGVVPNGSAGEIVTPAKGDDAPSTWAEAVQHVMTRDKLNALEAGRLASKEFAHLHPVFGR